MADFYVNYGSQGAKLLAQYKIGKLNITLHRVNDNLFVLSKNRRIMIEDNNPFDALHHFTSAVNLEYTAPLSFNN